ncbi:hypothetical protein CEXT_313951 [Caerostris extrusa]|uniref:Uncharacterized protein n=1 Tax=Caerostris extrusa TaxID=172846 RepID=A0AAV4PDL7_CAEEX|nr:hypothetical protein CEXT_313951 [Caerostris extrusa]
MVANNGLSKIRKAKGPQNGVGKKRTRLEKDRVNSVLDSKYCDREGAGSITVTGKLLDQANSGAGSSGIGINVGER